MNTIYFNKEDNQEYAYIGIIENLFDNKFDYLNSMTDFKSGNTSFGEIPRLQKWYQMDNHYFSKTWKEQDIERWKSHVYDKELLNIQEYVRQNIDNLDIYNYNGISKPKINSCLINKYRDGNDSIKPHRDNQTTFGDNPTVIGVSFGDERDIIFKRLIYNPDKMNSIKIDKENKQELKIKLKHGSMFIMAGAIQKYFSHEIPKCNSNDIRYSLTFREFYK
jgi:hypothetical protein